MKSLMGRGGPASSPAPAASRFELSDALDWRRAAKKAEARTAPLTAGEGEPSPEAATKRLEQKAMEVFTRLGKPEQARLMALFPKLAARAGMQGCSSSRPSCCRCRRTKLSNGYARTIEPPPPTSDVLTADEAAAFLGVDRNTVYDYAGRGVIPHQRLGKRILFGPTALVSWLDSSLCKATSTRKG